MEEKKNEFNLVETFSLAVVFPVNSHLHLRDTPFGFTANLYDQRWTIASTGFVGRIFWALENIAGLNQNDRIQTIKFRTVSDLGSKPMETYFGF